VLGVCATLSSFGALGSHPSIKQNFILFNLMLKTDILELPIRNKIQDTYVLFLYFVPCSYNKLDSIAKHKKIIYQVFEAKVYYTNNR